MPVPVIIITGFLGSGKTSLLRRLLPACGAAEVRPALIINEVGNTDVDGELLADLHAEQVKLVGGCVCCTLQAQLAETLYDILERRAGEVILIECSGLSNPLDVLQVLSAPALLREAAVSHVVCLLDAHRADKVLRVAELATAQVAAADLVVLNKADLATPEERAAAEARVRTLAPHADAVWTEHGDPGAAWLRRLATDGAPTGLPALRGEGRHEHGHEHEHGHGHGVSLPASFWTAAYALPEALPRAAVEALLRDLPAEVLRAKGFACLEDEGWHVLHRVFDTADIYPLPGDPPRAGALLVCIGQHLHPPALAALVEQAVGRVTG